MTTNRCGYVVLRTRSGFPFVVSSVCALVLWTAVTFIFVLLAGAPVKAADFTVQNGQTVGGQTLTTPGDTGTIEAGGTISTAGDGVGDVGAVNNLTVLNSGTIISTGQNGIDIDGDNGVITNNGLGASALVL